MSASMSLTFAEKYPTSAENRHCSAGAQRQLPPILGAGRSASTVSLIAPSMRLPAESISTSSPRRMRYQTRPKRGPSAQRSLLAAHQT
ncbi:hypothetical protein DX912_00195 [Lysobacter soli]|uniref:Uncharacterized protein n=1 Tax=Lysobacter soli TaxID=453783 RepID=A0A3D8VIS7_9GAMM|nr:hypothetical protein DX912_00195 [Lysobacter soli]